MSESEYDNLARMIKTGFDEVYERIDGVESSLVKKFNDLEERMDAGFAGVNRRIDDLAEKLGNHEERIVKLEHEILP